MNREASVEAFGLSLNLAMFAVEMALDHYSHDADTCECPTCERLSTALDYGWRHTATLWLALDPDEQQAWLDGADEAERHNLPIMMSYIANVGDIDAAREVARKWRRAWEAS
jgi:hypothetical protein